MRDSVTLFDGSRGHFWLQMLCRNAVTVILQDQSFLSEFPFPFDFVANVSSGKGESNYEEHLYVIANLSCLIFHAQWFVLQTTELLKQKG